MVDNQEADIPVVDNQEADIPVVEILAGDSQEAEEMSILEAVGMEDLEVDTADQEAVDPFLENYSVSIHDEAKTGCVAGRIGLTQVSSHQ